MIDLNSNVPTVVEQSSGVNRKWFLGETTITRYSRLLMLRSTEYDAQPVPRMTQTGSDGDGAIREFCAPLVAELPSVRAPIQVSHRHIADFFHNKMKSRK